MTLSEPTAALRELQVDGTRYSYYSLRAAEEMGIAVERLPYCLRIVLENLLRQCAEGTATPQAVQALGDWLHTRSLTQEIGFKPARVMMVDSSGLPALGDLAAMRDAIVRLGGDATRINPAVPVDFVVDHSVHADHTGSPDALRMNMSLEFQRNRERYEFLRWGMGAFNNFRLIPPGNGICHQINLEYLARVVWTRETEDGLLAYPDSVLGMDSHTPMINSLGVVGWGVGGLEGGTAALGEPVSMLLPRVVACRLSGKPGPGITAMDMVLTITETLRKHDLVGAFVEYTGDGVDALTLPDRATISNMTPELGATLGYFPIDAETLRFLRLTGRPAHQLALVEAYAKKQKLWRHSDAAPPDYSDTISIDLSAIAPVVSGPSRPEQRQPLSEAAGAFAKVHPTRPEKVEGLADGHIVIAAITSCTNTSNPAAMIAAGLLARNAVREGLTPPWWVKTSLSPGSRVVPEYLTRNGLLEPLATLGFHITGFGCMTCMGNSGPVRDEVVQAVESGGRSLVSVMSGNRNFEGRVHPMTKANFLASPPLVVAYALAGSILVDLQKDPIGVGAEGVPVYLRDIWPDPDEVRRMTEQSLAPALFAQQYASVEQGSDDWQSIATSEGLNFQWKPDSSFIRRPPFFDGMELQPPPVTDVRGARALAIFGDMLTTDHISPGGAISPGTPAAHYLESLGIARRDFVNYNARRLNHDVMTRGTFANIRIRNEMVHAEGGVTRHVPSGEAMSIFDAAERYKTEGVPVIVIAGANYGAGSSRDWAAKGARLLGIRCVVAESFERIHRSNLVGIGVLPLQFMSGTNRQSLQLDGNETFDVLGIRSGMRVKEQLELIVLRADGSRQSVPVTARLDTEREVQYFEQGGILHVAFRERLGVPVAMEAARCKT